jgi:AcrR family transcriptional regulator
MHFPKQERGKKTREKLIAAGKELFSKKGYYAATSKEIVKQAGVSIGSFYDYFPDKKMLFLEILTDYRDKFLTDIRNMEGVDSPVIDDVPDLISALVAFSFEQHQKAPAFHNEAVLLRYTDPDIGKVFNEWDELNRQFIYRLLAAADAFTRIEDAESASHLILRTIEENIHAFYFNHSRIARETLQGELTDLIVRYVVP